MKELSALNGKLLAMTNRRRNSMELPELPNPFTNAKVIGPDIDPEVYHRQEPGVGPGNPAFVMSRSQLKAFSACPEKWRRGVKPTDSDSTEWGSMIDCLMLTPHRFDSLYAVAPETCTATKTMDIVKKGKAAAGDQIPWNPLCAEAKEWKEEQKAAGKICLTQEERAEASTAQANLMADPYIGPLIKLSQKQVMIVAEYHDKATRLIVPMKFLIDLVPRMDSPSYGQDLADLKSARDGSPGPWGTTSFKEWYHVQGAMCLDAWNAATGENRINFRHVIVENSHPHQQGRRLLGQDQIDRGRLDYISALRSYCQCLQTNKWPSWDDKPDPQSNEFGWTVVRLPMYASTL